MDEEKENPYIVSVNPIPELALTRDQWLSLSFGTLEKLKYRMSDSDVDCIQRFLELMKDTWR